jgi:hypothetical protein
MPRKNEEHPEREERIEMEIVVDAYGPDERAMGWYCYLENTLRFPFTARCAGRRATSPLHVKDKVEVIAMAHSDECLGEMFVTIRWNEEDELAVPLAQLKVVKADEPTREAVEDWHYWVEQGYEF